MKIFIKSYRNRNVIVNCSFRICMWLGRYLSFIIIICADIVNWKFLVWSEICENVKCVPVRWTVTEQFISVAIAIIVFMHWRLGESAARWILVILRVESFESRKFDSISYSLSLVWRNFKWVPVAAANQTNTLFAFPLSIVFIEREIAIIVRLFTVDLIGRSRRNDNNRNGETKTKTRNFILSLLCVVI